jgi:hypothetical protein
MLPAMPFNTSAAVKMTAEKSFPGGFVFLDRASRFPLENVGKSRSRRSVITLKDFHATNDTPANSFPLQLPFGMKDRVTTKEQESDSRNEVPTESALLPRLPFRSSNRDSGEEFMRAHYNEANQEDARKQYMNSNRKIKIKSLTDLDLRHMDPEERKSLPSWDRIPASPASMAPPLLPLSKAEEPPQTKSQKNVMPASTWKGRSLSESKNAADGSNSLRGSSITKPESTSRLYHNATAA